ncbi:aldose 1-epimerase [Gammaproteobacteria bacterium]|nr:aldose 1-epimerase [Gammaproteobacteria bacterium]
MMFDSALAAFSVIDRYRFVMTSTSLELKRCEWRLRVDPVFGGSVTGLWLGDTAVLRPTQEGANHAGQSSAYPLVPFSNRIGQGQMDWGGERYRVRNGFNTEAHALHGVGFMTSWTVVDCGAQSLSLRMEHTANAYWPFAFEAEQHFELLADGLRHTLSAKNTDICSQPMGLGWHPHFVSRPGATLDLPVHTQWLAGEDLLPDEARAVLGLSGSVSAMRLDHCFEGADCTARMVDHELTTTLESDSRYWVVYTPIDADFYCVEPVTHLNNALQQARPMDHGLASLAPGETLSQTTLLRCQRSA